MIALFSLVFLVVIVAALVFAMAILQGVALVGWWWGNVAGMAIVIAALTAVSWLSALGMLGGVR